MCFGKKLSKHLHIHLYIRQNNWLNKSGCNHQNNHNYIPNHNP